MKDFEVFARRLGVSKNSLQQALTHYSFYEDKDEKKGNGRLVFAGMFVFKGQVAEVLDKYFSGNGTQLQHVLGNLFRKEYLNRIFDDWNLKKYIRCSESFDIETHKHIFIYAIFGCIAKENENTRRQFITKYIINEQNNHLLTHIKRNRDFENQTKTLSKKILGKDLNIEMSVTENMLHHAKVKFSDDIILAEAISKSYRYARRKALKLSLEIITNINFERYANESNYNERVKKRIEEEKRKQEKAIEEKIEEKEKKRIEKKEKVKRLNQIRDAARRKAQAEAKKRKAERARLAEEQAKKAQAPISAKKRRYLEDKKK